MHRFAVLALLPMLAACAGTSTATPDVITDIRMPSAWSNASDGLVYLIQEDPDRGRFYIQKPAESPSRTEAAYRAAAEDYLAETPGECAITDFRASGPEIYDAEYVCTR